ncbi:MAG: alpha/beta hydrolase [Cyclobacteriaceae bacterium]|nr:alpha/beta hydrolase [Cyclobacteriaceae bacterium]MDH4295838.1 alpha/beta hydrolase [Cyclobacteriaceae bacterium]MDH5247682.1 alpha/beta hydrolase [Cyclobacteriaceae bacterium]
MKIIFILLALYGAMKMSNAQSIVKLYPDKIPNEIPGPDNETRTDDGIVRISSISRPTLTLYLPPKDRANGTAVVICPGGGYGISAFQHEGVDVAKQLSAAGIAGIVLKYRLPNDEIMKDKSIGPLQDAQQAIKVVREHAKEWNIDPAKIGVAGFSAGGHLASTAGTHFNKVLIDNPEKTSVRPDFMILLYPVISFTDSLGHTGSRNNLIGKSPSQELIKLYSNELQVTKQTPPTFIVHAGDDASVKVENSLRFYESLKKNGVLAELFIYPKGGHGFGLVNPTSPDRWMDRCLDWMKSNGWL